MNFGATRVILFSSSLKPHPATWRWACNKPFLYLIALKHSIGIVAKVFARSQPNVEISRRTIYLNLHLNAFLICIKVYYYTCPDIHFYNCSFLKLVIYFFILSSFPFQSFPISILSNNSFCDPVRSFYRKSSWAGTLAPSLVLFLHQKNPLTHSSSLFLFSVCPPQWLLSPLLFDENCIRKGENLFKTTVMGLRLLQ